MNIGKLHKDNGILLYILYTHRCIYSRYILKIFALTLNKANNAESLLNKGLLRYHKRPPVKASGPIWYLGNWRDKAGGYGIQEPFGMLAVKRIEGDFYNVVGLPISRLYQELRDLGLM